MVGRGVVGPGGETEVAEEAPQVVKVLVGEVTLAAVVALGDVAEAEVVGATRKLPIHSQLHRHG